MSWNIFKEIRTLKDRVTELENPFRFKIGDKVIYNGHNGIHKGVIVGRRYNHKDPWFGIKFYDILIKNYMVTSSENYIKSTQP